MDDLVILGTVGGLILIDLVLSSDNALVIGAVAAKLPRRQRLSAIIVGGGCAIILRILFTVTATLLLQIPLVQIIGAAIILYIAIKLLRDRNQDQEKSRPGRPAARQPTTPKPENRQFLNVMSTIVVADVSMSLDNVLAIGALAAGNFLAIAFGLLLSILILLVAAAIVAEFIARFSWLLDLASLALAWTAAKMVLNDGIVGPGLQQITTQQVHLPVAGSVPLVDLMIYGLFFAAVLIIDLFLRLSGNRTLTSSAAEDAQSAGMADEQPQPTSSPHS